jgi:hypothetical protein
MVMIRPPDRLLDHVGRLFDPDKGRGVLVPVRDVVLDVADQGARTVSKDPRRTGLRVRMLHQASTRFSQEAPVAVKCWCTRGCAASQAWAAGIECVDELSTMRCSSRASTQVLLKGWRFRNSGEEAPG